MTPGGLSHNPYKVLKDGYLPTVGNANALKNMNDTNVSDLDVSKAPSIVIAPFFYVFVLRLYMYLFD